MKLNGLITDITLSITLKRGRSITIFRALIDSNYTTDPEIIVLYKSRSLLKLKPDDRIILVLNRAPLSKLLNFTNRVERVSIYL